MKIVPIILSGGSGSRLWPLSRVSHPKQFLKLKGIYSLFQLTVSRVSDEKLFHPPIIVANIDHRFLIEEQCADIDVFPSDVIVEPFAKNTAPAIVVSLLAAQKKYGDILVLILPSDHLIDDVSVFCSTIRNSFSSALNDNIVAFGITPTFPATQYGYLHTSENNSVDWLTVDKFIEKPSLFDCQSMIKDSHYYWNSGIIFSKNNVLLSEINKFIPVTFEHSVNAFEKSICDLNFIMLNLDFYSLIEAISIDYSVMEKSNLVTLYPLLSDWSDIGSWDSLSNVFNKDSDGNTFGESTYLNNTKNCFVYGSSRSVAILGAEDLIVVDTPDALLITKKEFSQEVRNAVHFFNKTNSDVVINNRKVYRPWGFFEGIALGDRYKIKLIIVNPGHSLSVQKHFHRSEHWVVVRGTAQVTVNDVSTFLHENQSIDIPTGAIHSLKNLGKLTLEIVEVQSGSYLDEDDIVRISDNYGRL